MEGTIETKIEEITSELEVIKDKIDNHIQDESSHLGHIRKSFHEINDSLQILKNPVIRVKNGVEKDMFEKDAIAELWSATYPLRLASDVLMFLHNHKFIRKVVLAILIFAFMGVLSTPIYNLIEVIKSILKLH